MVDEVAPQTGMAGPDVDGVSVPLLIGREDELTRLGQVLTNTSALVLIEGEAGVGKSRLLDEFLSSPTGSVHSALTAVCPPLREPYTLGPIVDAVLTTGVDALANLRLSGLAGALRPLFPEWAEHLPPAPEPAEDASASRHRVLRALAELLDKLGVDLLVVDDAQWSDDATREFLLFLAERDGPGPSLVVAYRPEDLVGDPWLLRLSGRRRPRRALLRLVLDPLDLSETAALASSMLANQQVSDEFAQHLHARTEGLPLAVEECVRLMARRGDLIRRDHGWKRLPLDEIVVPPTVRDTVLEHASRLDVGTRSCCELPQSSPTPSLNAFCCRSANCRRPSSTPVWLKPSRTACSTNATGYGSPSGTCWPVGPSTTPFRSGSVVRCTSAPDRFSKPSCPGRWRSLRTISASPVTARSGAGTRSCPQTWRWRPATRRQRARFCTTC